MFMIQSQASTINANNSTAIPDIKGADYLIITGFTSGGGFRGTTIIPAAVDCYFNFVSASGSIAKCVYYASTRSITNESTFAVNIYRIFGIK